MIKLIINIFINSLIFFLSLYSIYGMFSLVGQAIDLKKKQFDELQRKLIFDSLAYSMLTLLAIHTLERIVEFVLFIIVPNLNFANIITIFREPGTIFGNASIFDKIFFDCAIISIIYTILRYKYGLITRKDALKPILICAITSLIVFSFVFLAI